ncbi:MAG: Ribosome-binding ATPase YchF [Microgenomates bacterium OLB22]|nr:MAG: Ribosome-binding ATPase YchF [Microgenomates bacterium OLB22]
MLKIGIVGLPNVGKSTLFNALLKKQVADVANYPFCTIEPNVGVIEVPDPRLEVLADIVCTTTLVPAAIEFYDIAGLVKGASRGEGLGNQFLTHIREVDAIAHVIRFFTDEQIHHVDGSLNPSSDIQTIETELILKDLETLTKQRRPNKKLEKTDEQFYNAVDKLVTSLNEGIPARLTDLSDEELSASKQLQLLTAKPIFFICNVSEDQLQQKQETEKEIEKVLEALYPTQTPHFVIVSAKLEQELSQLPEEDQIDFLAEYGLKESGLNRVVNVGYALLQLISYLTAGVKEVRAWTIAVGTKAPQAAAVIHTDFEKKFIKAEVVSYAAFVSAGGWLRAREQGKAILAGKDYVVQDGDVIDFKIGA